MSRILLIWSLLLLPIVTEALPHDYYAPTSPFSSGRWVKVEVGREGIYQLTDEQLRQLGFTDPSRVTVHGYPAAILSSHSFSSTHPDGLPRVISCHNGGKLIFYAFADYLFDVNTTSQLDFKRNLYDRRGYYFITDSQPIESDTAIIPAPKNDEDTPEKTHTAFTFNNIEEYNPAEGGPYLFSRKMKKGESRTFKVSLPGYTDSNNSLMASLFFRYIGYSDVQTSIKFTPGDGMTVPATGGVSLAKLRAASSTADYKYYPSLTPHSQIKFTPATDDSVSFTLSHPGNGSCDFVSVDYFGTLYPRNNTIPTGEGLRMNFVTGTKNTVSISNADANTVVWNITDPLSSATHGTADNGDGDITFYLPDTQSPQAVVAFNPGDIFPQPIIKGEINDADLHGLTPPDMVIITIDRLMSQAEKIAEFHRNHQGMDVAVVEQGTIFNEFSSGARSPHGIRRFLKMLHDREPGKLKYLLLIGKSDIDNRGVLTDTSDRLVIYENESESESRHDSYNYASDNYYGCLGDDFALKRLNRTPMDISVGRLPSDSPKEIEDYLAKMEVYMQRQFMTPSYNNTLILTDSGDKNSHLMQGEQMETHIHAHAPGMTVTKAYSALYPYSPTRISDALHNALSKAFAGGQGLFCYSGHSSDNRLGTHSELLTSSRMDNMHYPTFPIAMMVSCNINKIDRDKSDFCRHALLLPEKGFIGVIGSCRSVYQEMNIRLALNFIQAYTTPQAGDCLGDIYRRAHNSTVGESATAGINALCFNLCGDPALPLYGPDRKANLLSIDGTYLSDNLTEVSTLFRHTLKGNITTADGETDTSFNGTVTLNFNEPTFTVKSRYGGQHNTGDLSPIDVTRDETLLASYVTKVENGVWEADILLPSTSNYGESNNIHIYAASPVNKTAAQGNATVKITPPSPDDISDDTSAPIIGTMYINYPESTDGSVTGSVGNILHATIEDDESGISVSDVQIGGGVRLIIDGRQSVPSRHFLAFNPDGSASLRYPLPPMAEGQHVARISVSDHCGNTSSRSLSFTVMNDNDARIECRDEPSRDEAVFTLSHSLPGEPTARIIVEDAAGNTVFSKDGVQFPYTWDIMDNNGHRVTDGIYKAYGLLSSGSIRTCTPRVTFTIIER